MYHNLFFGNCYSCNIFCHIATNCKAHLSWNHQGLDQTINPKVKSRRDENPFSSLTKFDVECYTCHNFGHLARECQLNSIKQEKEEAEIFGIALCEKWEKNEW